MYDRLFDWPKKTSFLFGPRGTGKSTWIRSQNENIFVVDLLDTTLQLEYSRSPELFRQTVLASAKPSQWVVVDEIQKVPKLLDEVHLLIENHNYKKFLLTGSSARKLRTTSANLLGGRARNLRFFPLNFHETQYSLKPEICTLYGMLPISVTEKEFDEKEAYLQGYIENYLLDEIKRESQIKNISGFQRFLQIAAMSSGTPINQSNISRDAGISRDSVRLYFEVLVDTLLGFWLPAFRPQAKIKEIARPKFYFFDSGVANACAGYFKQAAPSEWKGILFETWLLHEIRSYLELFKIKGEISYWQTPSESEIDIVWRYGKKIVLIEVKAAKKFRKDFLTGIHSFKQKYPRAESFVVYQGKDILEVNNSLVLPVEEFLLRLYQKKSPIK